MALSTDEFLNQVRDAAPITAVFDYDGTLWPGDAGSGFMDWSFRTALLSLEKIAWLRDRHTRYHAGEVDEVTICGEMVQVYAGLREEDVRASARAYFEAKVEPHLFPTMVDLVRNLKQSGVQVWAVSSTSNWVIEEGVRALGIAPDRVLAACVASEAGYVTDTLQDVPSDERKAGALLRMGIPAPDVVFGNSIHDAAMLAIAKRPFAVNPTPALLAFAEERGWPVYYPVSQTYGSTEKTASLAGSV